MRRPHIIILGLFVMLGWVDLSEARQGAVPTTLLQKGERQGKIRVIARFGAANAAEKSADKLTETMIAHRQKVIEKTRNQVMVALKDTGARMIRQFDTIPFLALEVTPAALRALERSEYVLEVGEDHKIELALADSVPIVESDLVQQAGFDGGGQTVVIVDDGIDRVHPALEGKVVWEVCYQSDGGCPNGGTQQFGPGAAMPASALKIHGTHVASIAAGRRWITPSGQAMTGVAPGAEIVAINVFGAYPNAWNSDIVAALDYVYSTLRYTWHIAAVNLSLGDGRNFTSPCDAAAGAYSYIIRELRDVGIATVAASGNDHYTNGMSAPACIESAVSVGATTKADRISSFSNSAPFLSLLAPGESIESAVPGGSSRRLAGTSMAAPHVTGAWALLRQTLPTAPVSSVLGSLRREGLPLTDPKSGVSTPRIQILQAMAVLANVYAASSAPSCRNVDVRDRQTGFSTNWCGYLTINWELAWCREHVDPLTQTAWSNDRQEQYADFFKKRCEWHVYCAVPMGTLETPYCDLETAVAQVPIGGTIGLMSGQSFHAPLPITKPSRLIAVGGDVRIEPY